MATEQQFKRNVAYKLRVNDILVGKPILEGEKFSFLDFAHKKIVRVNIIGNIVDKYESQGDKKYIFFTLDDGSGQIKLKSFGDDYEKFKEKTQGQTVIVIGNLRYYNGELYLAPEIIRESDSKYLLVRKLELEKDRSKNPEQVVREQIIAVKDRILDTIKNAEKDGGIEMEQIVKNLGNVSPEIVEQEVQKFIEEGIVFEPRPGKMRYLG